jgi:16S rRNA (guanine527-N7)-methyltransferase
VNVAPAPPDAADVFGDRLPLAVAYAELLCDQALTRGLIGPREPQRIWERHLLNSAALAELVPTDDRVVDLGSGAGLPGIPLALARPDLEVTLLEPMARRARFLRECCQALGLELPVVEARAEVAGGLGAGVVVARAVAPLPRLVELASFLLRRGGVLLALKGATVEAEIADMGRTGPPVEAVQTLRCGRGAWAGTVVRVVPAPKARDTAARGGRRPKGSTRLEGAR